jgi:hypothetical protein
MGAATYIGRVGALAVALGVGTAVATGHGVARADETSAGPSSSSSSTQGSAGAGSAGAAGGSSKDASGKDTSTTDSTKDTPGRDTPGEDTDSTTTSSPTAASAQPDTATSSSADETSTRPSPKSSTTTSKTVADGVVVSAQTNTGSSTGNSATKTPDELEQQPPAAEPEVSVVEPEVEEPDSAEPAASAPKVTTPPKNPKPNDPAPTASAAVPGPATRIDLDEAVQTIDATAGSDRKTLGDSKSRTEETPEVAAATALGVVAVAAKSAATAQVAVVDVPQPVPVVAPRNPLEALSSLASSVVNWVLSPLIGKPVAPATPPLAWSLLAFARREFDNFVAAVTGRATEAPAVAVDTTSLSLAAATTALAQAAVNVPGFPLPGAQLSPSTQFVQWVTGNYQTGNPLIADTFNRFGITGTDVGVIWDNGMVDDPSTPYNEHQVLMAFGDTFSGANMTGNWRFNVLLRSADTVLSDGMTIPDGEWFNGNMFGGTPLGDETFARQIIHPDGLPAGITLIPTAGIALPTPGTQFGVTQYVNFMSVTNWGAAGTWSTNYSAIAYSTDNGENWTVAPTSVRYNQPWSGNNNFQQGAFVRPGDGYVYSYGTPNGRQGAAYVSRVLEKDILDVSKYEYYSKGAAGFFGIGATPAGWYKNNPAAATPIFGQDTGACGVANPGNQVSEMSVQYNKQLKKYVVLHADQFNNIVMRTSDTPQGTWSSAKVLMKQQSGGIYAPMMHPWSPSTMGTGSDLYWNLSLYSQYNVMLMKTDLTKT